MGYVKGVAYIVLWYASILCGYAGLFCPILPLVFISNRLYRSVADFLFTFWQMYPTALLEFFFDCKVQVTGDPIDASETSLLVMNHRTRTDWNFLWPAVYHSTTGSGRLGYPTKFVLKDQIRHIPGIGWVMQLACFLYIKRNWLVDRIKIKRMVDYFCDLNHKFSLLIFPEGTDLTAETKLNSDRFAEKFCLQKYEYVLHPRTTGFAYLGKRLLDRGALDAIYDVTIIYCDSIPQNEMMIINGSLPREIKVHFSKHKASTLPRSEDGLKTFLERRWQEKERNIREFHSSRHFLHGRKIARANRTELIVALIFWTLLPYFVVYLIVVEPIFRHIVMGHTVFLLFINYVGDGFQNFEIAIYDLKRKLGRKLYFD